VRALIVDDEELARGYLRELLAAHPEIEIAGECANGFDAVKSISEIHPDLVFLDVQMPKLDGFEVLELIDSTTMPVVIFVTAFNQYATRAFDAHAVDYLLKPFSAERLARALERAKSRLGERRIPEGLAAEARRSGDRPQRIVVKDGTRIHIIPLAKLDYVEAQDDYVALHSEGKTHLKQQSIASVDLERVARIEPYGKESRIVILTDGSRLPVSRTGYARLLEAMDSNSNRQA
jgi:two-component system LytT family response regulator